MPAERYLAKRRLAEPADLYRIPIWMIARLLYAVLPVSMLFRLATAKGTMMSVLSRRRLRILERIRQTDLETTTGERRRIVRHHLQYLERERLATLWPCMRGFPGSEAIEIQGRDHLDKVLRAGRGAIIVTPHFGYARLLKPILVSHGFRALLIGPDDNVRVHGYPSLTRVGRLARKRALRLPWPEPEDELWMRAAGYDLVAELNIRPHLAALARNEILITLPEGRGGLALHRVSMMGIDILMSPAVLSMARHTGAAVLPAFVEDDAGSPAPLRVRLVIERPLSLSTDNGGPEPMAADLQALAAVFESWIRASPHLWLAWSGPPLTWWGRPPQHATR